jgi:hypothetical protein
MNAALAGKISSNSLRLALCHKWAWTENRKGVYCSESHWQLQLHSINQQLWHRVYCVRLIGQKYAIYWRLHEKLRRNIRFHNFLTSNQTMYLYESVCVRHF